jgi:hypothetical protein
MSDSADPAASRAATVFPEAPRAKFMPARRLGLAAPALGPIVEFLRH